MQVFPLGIPNFLANAVIVIDCQSSQSISSSLGRYAVSSPLICRFVTLDISAISFHKMLQVAKKMDALEENASVLALTYVASHRTFFGYNDMADAKSLLESIARSFGYIYGREKGVRVNTISQSPTYTTAGSGIKGFDGLYDFSDRMSPLGNASADECADYCIVMFSDLTKKVTMQTLFHDGGFSNMGMSLRGMTQYNKSFIEENTDKETGKIIYG